jgi:hypothetical protein
MRFIVLVALALLSFQSNDVKVGYYVSNAETCLDGKESLNP